MKRTKTSKVARIFTSLFICLCVLTGSLAVIPVENAHAAVEVIVNSSEGVLTVRGDAPSGEQVSVTILNPGYDESDILTNGTQAIKFRGVTVAADGNFEMNITMNDAAVSGVYTLICSTKDTSFTQEFGFYTDADKIRAIEILSAEGPYGNVENLYTVFGLDTSELYSVVDKDVIAQILYLTPVYEVNIQKMHKILLETLCIAAYGQGVAEIIKDGYLSYTDVIGIDCEPTYEDYLSNLSEEGVDAVNRQVLGKGYENTQQIREEFSKSVLVNLITNNYNVGWMYVEEVFEKYDAQFQMFGLETTKLHSLSTPSRYEVYMELFHSGVKTFEDLIEFYYDAINRARKENTSSTGGGGGVGGGGSIAVLEPKAIYEKSDDGKTFNIECFNVEPFPVIILALYNQGKLSDVMISGGNSISATFETDCVYDSEKVMVWESFSNMNPVVRSENIKMLKCSTVQLNLENICDTESGTTSQDYDSIIYYPTSSYTKTAKYKISKDANYSYNYDMIVEDYDETAFEIFEGLIKDEDGNILSNTDMEITLTENTGDEYYDVVSVKYYNYDIIRAVDEDVNVLEGYLEDVTIESDEYATVVMKNADGEEITIDDFSKGDVIAYISDGGMRKNYDWIEIINLGNNCVSGMVDETDAARGVIYINSVKYSLAGVEMPWFGDEGTFYLTRTGKIFFIDTVSDLEYAYVLDAAYGSTNLFDYSWYLKLLTEDNEVVIHKVGEYVEFDDYGINATKADCDELEAFEAVENNDGADQDKSVDRVITYKLDDQNRIRKIDTVRARSFTGKEYYKDAQVLGADLADNAVIFNISSDKSKYYFASDMSYLTDRAEYSGWYITNAKGDNDCVVITEGGILIDYTQDIAVVESVTDAKINGGYTDAKKVRYYVGEDEELHTVTIVEDDDISRSVESSYRQVKAGSLMMLAQNNEGVASAYTVIAELDYDDAYVLNGDAIAEICDENEENSFIIGTIDNITTVSAGKKVETTGIMYTADGMDAVNYITVKSSSNAYTYQNRNGMTIIHVGDWRANNVEAGEGYIFIARLFNNSVNDIITNSMVTSKIEIPVDPEVGSDAW